jgi:hypothetical protein
MLEQIKYIWNHFFYIKEYIKITAAIKCKIFIKKNAVVYSLLIYELNNRMLIYTIRTIKLLKILYKNYYLFITKD